MRDPLTTRRLLAKIDRDVDVYVVLDRFRQSFYDLDDELAKLQKDIKLLQDAERRRVTETGVHRIIKSTAVAGGIGIAKWIMGALGALLVAVLSAAAGHYWK